MNDKHKFSDDCIVLPSINEQRAVVFELATNEAIQVLKDNLTAPVCNVESDFDESIYSDAHFLEKAEGWQAPDKEIVCFYLEQLKQFDKAFTGERIAQALGINARRLREYKQGKHKFPYGTWRKLLVITGRVPQAVEKVLMRL